MENYGLKGNILWVNLTTQEATTINTDKYAELTGGSALALRILANELPAELESAFDRDNLLIFSAGALVGSGLPGSCALSVAALSPTGGAVCQTVQGRFGSQLKYAGYDAVVISGAATTPVWLNINDNTVTVESAGYIWGQGTHNTTANIAAITGNRAAFAVIGPAGENQLDLASIVVPGGFEAPLLGGVMGSKNLKAIAVQGSGAMKPQNSADYIARLGEITTQYMGVAGGSVVPSTTQSWSEYSHEKSYWNAGPEISWGAANGSVQLAECPPGELATMGLRSAPVVRDFGSQSADSLLRMVACPSCATPCMSMLYLPNLEQAGLSQYALVSPTALRAAADLLPEYNPDAPAMSGEQTEDGEEPATPTYAYNRLEIAAAGAVLAEDFGISLQGGQLTRNWRFAVDNGHLEGALSTQEYSSFDWEKYRFGDPIFLVDLFRRIATKAGDIAELAGVNPAETWEFSQDYATASYSPVAGNRPALDSSLHGAPEAVLAAVSNSELRAPMVMLLDCGLPTDVLQPIVEEICGKGVLLDTSASGAIYPSSSDGGGLAAWSATQTQVCATLGLCPHIWPIAVTPQADNGYIGDIALPQNMLELVSGKSVGQDALQTEALTALCIERCMWALHQDSRNPAELHDTVQGWAVDEIGSGILADTMSAFYTELGWDSESGMPTASTMDKLLSGLALRDLL